MPELTLSTELLRTFKELEKISSAKKYMNDYLANKVLARYGTLYSANDVMIAAVDISGLDHVGDDGWKILTSYLDEKGYLKTLQFASFKTDMSSDALEKYFKICAESQPDMTTSFAPNVISGALKLFSINRINPCMCQNGPYIEFAGHNKQVSIRVVCAGMIGMKWR